MAHKLAHRLQSTGEHLPDIDRDGSGSTGVTRRRYVRLGGAAVATIAALGGRPNGVAAASADDADDRERLIRIRGSGAPSTYEVTADGELIADEAAGQATGHVSGSTAEGAVTSDDHGYRFRGEIYDVTVDGDADVVLDGETLER